MDDDPTIDGRTKTELLQRVRRIAPYYTEAWDPDSEDTGRVLVEVFSEMAGDVIERLDQVPGKHFVSFLASLGFDRHPPQPSRVPLAFHVTDDADENVTVPSGTVAVAEATDDGTEQAFEVPTSGEFEATPSTVDRVYSVDPEADAIFDHRQAIDGADRTELFAETNLQRHALYIGHEDLLTAKPGTTLRVAMETAIPASILEHCLVWEYYGEQRGDGETIEDWHVLGGDEADPCEWSELRRVESFLDRLERQFRRHGYRRANHSPDVRYRLLTTIAEEVRDGQFETAADLPWNLLGSDDPDDALVDPLLAELGSVRKELTGIHRSAAERQSRADGESIELTFELPGKPTTTTVAGRESKWMRCRIPEHDLARTLFGAEVGAVHLETESGTTRGSDGMSPDRALSNDVPLPVDGEALYPFGETPRRLDTVYVASEEAFTKRGTTVRVAFETDDDDMPGEERPPELSWEYWNGDGWDRIPGLRDGTNALTSSGTVAFTVPDDLGRTAVAGHDEYWIRARLVGGDYGQVAYEETGDGTWERVGTTPPRFDGVTIHYEQRESPQALVARNNLEFDDLAGAPGRFVPFRSAADETQTVYFGFDRPLTDGPIHVFFPVADEAYPEGFYPRVRWEYRASSDPDDWSRLDAEDGTEGFTGTGIVSLVVPEATVRFRLFGRERHWIRARITADEFTRTAAVAFEPFGRGESTTPRGVPDPLEQSLTTEPPTGRPTETPPVLRGIHPNVGWAYNVETIDEETVGSSDGSPSREFALSRPPVTDEEVWVDELSALSAGARAELEADPSVDVERVRGSGDGLKAFWVRWIRVGDLAGSSEDDRHYTLDRTAGSLAFGDGVRGRIPPRGRDSLRATYRTGGGVDGNVEAGAVTGLKTSIPLVESVTNPEPGSGGADEESTSRVLERGPRQLRDRDRAVSADDFEQVAMDASRELARTRCLPGMDSGGERRPGWVTVLVIPRARRRKPLPSVELEERVREAMRERAPATLVTSGRLVVRGPSYVEVSVRATIEAGGIGSISTLEETVANELANYLHPLSGGATGDGWAFGELPHLSGFYAMLERVDGVDHVRTLAVTFTGTDHDVTVTDENAYPDVAGDVLICSGTHEIRARRES